MHRIFLIFSSLFLFAQSTGAAELRVLSAGAIEPGLKAAAAAWQRETGVEVRINFATAPQLRQRVASGEAADVLIAPPAVIEEFARDQKVAQLRASVGRVGLGVAVRPGAPVPDISNAAAVQRAVLEAESITFNTASSGLYFEGWLKKIGIYDGVQAKTTRYPDGASVMEHLLKGRGRELGFGPITEILQFRDKGLLFIGPLPAEIQNYTSYTAAPHGAASNGETAAGIE